MNNEENTVAASKTDRSLKYHRREKILGTVFKIVYIFTALFVIAAAVTSLIMAMGNFRAASDDSYTGAPDVDMVDVFLGGLSVMIPFLVELEIFHILRCFFSPHRTRLEIYVNTACAVLMVLTFASPRHSEAVPLFFVLWIAVRVFGGIACILNPMD